MLSCSPHGFTKNEKKKTRTKKNEYGLLSRSAAHRTTNFESRIFATNVLFIYFLGYFYQVKVLNQYHNTPKNATPQIGEIEIWDL